MPPPEKSYGQIFHEGYVKSLGRQHSYVPYEDNDPAQIEACEAAANDVIDAYRERKAREYTHLQGSSQNGHNAACGRSGRTLSRHELKRGRVNCPDCIDLYRKELEDKAERTGVEQ